MEIVGRTITVKILFLVEVFFIIYLHLVYFLEIILQTSQIQPWGVQKKRKNE